MEPKGNVLYAYRCEECGHRGEQRLAVDSHDGAESNCPVCGATVTLEWDGGVTIDSFINIARRWHEENGYVGRWA
ncbi:putative regulatory protein, FmdB family [Burkholderia sp. D7]|nr:putative regulatory protein, FmdB family [Burkholderia sp. D7]